MTKRFENAIICQLEGYDSHEYKKVFEYTPEFKQINELA